MTGKENRWLFITEIIRRSSRSQLWVTAAIGLVTSVGICFELSKIYSKPDLFDINTPRYLVSRRDIDSGTIFSPADFGARAEPSENKPVADGITDQDLYLLQGAELTKEIVQGTRLTWPCVKLKGNASRLGPKIPHGMRAYPLNPEFLPVRPGDRVDIVLTPNAVTESPFIIVDAALVLASGYRREIFEILIALSPAEIEWVEKGKQKGTLKIALRNPDDRSARPRRPEAKRTPNKQVRPIEILTEAP